MLLRDYELQLETMKCSPHSEEAGCLVDLGQDITPVLPYLNALLRRCRYNPHAPCLEIEHEGRGIALWAWRIAFGGVSSRAEAEEVMTSIKALINDTWERRGQLVPSERRGPCLSPLDLYRLLPNLNCAVCGEATCLAFAAKLARETATLEQCSPLAKPEYADRRKPLVAMLLEAGYEPEPHSP